MTDLAKLKDDLVTANRVLAYHHVVDSFGHVSVRNPENPNHFFLSRARAPNCVELHDITEFTFDGQIVGHNPGLSDFAAELCDEPIEALVTGAFCSLQFDATAWREVVHATARQWHQESPSARRT